MFLCAASLAGWLPAAGCGGSAGRRGAEHPETGRRGGSDSVRWEYRTVVLFGKGYAFSLPALPGWTVSLEEGGRLGRAAVYQSSEAGVRVRVEVVERQGRDAESLAKAIARRIEGRGDMVKRSPSLAADGERKKAGVWSLSGTGGERGAVALLDEGRVTVAFAFSARDENGRKRGMDALKALVTSYRWLSGI